MQDCTYLLVLDPVLFMYSHSWSKCFLYKKTTWKICWLAFPRAPNILQWQMILIYFNGPPNPIIHVALRLQWMWAMKQFPFPAMWAIWELIHCCWGPFCLEAPWPRSGHLLWNSSQQLQILISLARYTSTSPTLKSQWCQLPVATWGSSWKIIKCINQLSSKWSYPDNACSSMSRKEQLHIWFIASRDNSGVYSLC